MPDLRSPSGRYVCYAQGDQNFVIYPVLPNGEPDGAHPAWDEWSHEAARGETAPAPIVPIPPPVSIEAEPRQRAGGGFVEHVSSTAVRPRLTRAEISALLPPQGNFTFPAPYNTGGIRLAPGGTIIPRNYSYWRQINNHVDRSDLLVFVATRERGPILLAVNKASGQVTDRGPIADFGGEAEGWYFSATLPTSIYLIRGAQFLRYDVESGRLETIYRVDDGQMLWQPSSSDDDQVHAATVKRPAADPNAAYDVVGCAVFRHGQLTIYQVSAGFDECILDRSGAFLLIQEDDGNRVIDLATDFARTIPGAAGAVGHCDTGLGFVAGEDNEHEPCACVWWDLAQPFTPEHRRVIYRRPDWDGGMGHAAVVRDRVLISNGLGADRARVNELVMVRTAGDGEVLVIAPNLMIDLPVRDVPYDLQPKANVDPLGQFALVYANGTGQLEPFLVELPPW